MSLIGLVTWLIVLWFVIFDLYDFVSSFEIYDLVVLVTYYLLWLRCFGFCMVGGCLRWVCWCSVACGLLTYVLLVFGCGFALWFGLKLISWFWVCCR